MTKKYNTSISKICSLLLIVICTSIFSSCTKQGEYIRFANYYSTEVYTVVAGTVDIGDVPSGNTSGYKLINTGNFSVSGHTSSGQALSGSGSITGSGTHYWTMTLSASGQMSISLDR